MVLIAEDAHAELGARNVTELDGAGETLVLLGIVVLEADLEFDSLQKLTLLAGLLGNLEDLLHALVQSLLRNFGSHVFSC